MTLLKSLFGLVLCLGAAFCGSVSFLMTGIGICGSPALSWNIFLPWCGGGALCAFLAAALWPRNWFVGATVFSVISGLMLLLAMAGGEWKRSAVIALGIAIVFAVAHLGSAAPSHGEA